MTKIEISYVPVDALSSAPVNARTHTREQRRKLRRSIKRYGFLVPIVIDERGRIICGHERVAVAKELNLSEVPAVAAVHFSAAEIEAFALAENRISDDGGYDRDALSGILTNILTIDAEFELADTGFDLAEIDLLLLDEEEPKEPAAGPIDRSRSAISRAGDCWRTGDHLVACGDARDPLPYSSILQGDAAQLVVADLPYNLPIQGFVSGLGGVQHAEFPMASGEMSRPEFVAFLSDVSAQMVQASSVGAIHFLFMDFRHIGEILEGAGPHYSELKNLCVWVKSSGGMGSLYRSQHELVFVYKVGKAPHVNNVQLGRHGRSRTNVWQYAGANSFGKQREDLKLHATVKPVDMLADAILDCSERGGIVLDPFLGSGSTILAAERTGRRGRGIELDPYYVDLAAQRIAQAVGEPAVLVASGETFESVAHRRANPGWGEAA